MAIDSSFAAAYIDNGNNYRFFHIKVRPFCLWHLLLLQIINSPFVCGGMATLWDLKTAIGVCRLQYRESKIRRPFLPRWVGKKRLKKVMNRFMEYVGDYSSEIEYNIIPYGPESEKPGPRIVPPPNAVMMAFNAAHGARISIAEAWNMSLGEAQIAQAIYFHMQGTRISFFDDEEKSFQKEMKEAGL